MVRWLWSLILVVIMATPAEGQGLRWRVVDLLRFGNCGEPLCLDVDNAHGNHYIAASAQQSGQILAFLSNAIGASISSIPVGGSSGGSTFSFEGGLPVRSTVSAGPIFAERAQTIGRGRILAGGNATVYDFASIRSVPLSALRFIFTHVNVGDPQYGEPIFENDIIQVDTHMDVRVSIASTFLTYGLTDRLDVGVAVPLVNTEVSGISHAVVIPFGETPHTFGPGGQVTSQASMDGSAFGIGDILVRAKASLGESEIGSVAVLGDLRVPTGNDDELLGAGSTSLRVLGILSGSLGDFSPHLNAGVIMRNGDFERNAVLATVGFDHLLTPETTLAADFITSWDFGERILSLPPAQVFDVPYRRTVSLTNIPDRSDNTGYLSLGVKYGTNANLTLIANLLAPVIRGGFQPGAAGTIGVEYNR